MVRVHRAWIRSQSSQSVDPWSEFTERGSMLSVVLTHLLQCSRVLQHLLVVPSLRLFPVFLNVPPVPRVDSPSVLRCSLLSSLQEMSTLSPVLLLLLLLLSTRASLTHCAAAPPPTFTDTDPVTGGQLECNRCPPGTHLRARCTATKTTECAPCPKGSFTELWNYIGKCLRCGVCGQNQVEKSACNASSDCQCECKQGYYFSRQFDMCLRHSECAPGQGVLTEGTAYKDTVCHVCLNDTFSDTSSARKSCQEHRNCSAAGLRQVLKGSTWHDDLCTSCDPLKSRDGADYLKEIIPAFFVHQKLAVRRLRRIVHKLPSEDGRRQRVTSGLNLAQLHQRIDAWVASAAAMQIRELPAVLTKSGATSAGERLEKKLQRIDAQLTELCALGNEVDVVVGAS